MAIKKRKPQALSLTRAPFDVSLQNVVDQGNLLISVLDAALQHGAINGKAKDMVEERMKAFREAMYGEED